MNKKIFNSAPHTSNRPVANTVNEAGGAAYKRTDENALAQLIVTGTLNNVFYATGAEQLDQIKNLAANCSDEFLAKAAIYASRIAKMKDTPVVLLSILANRGAIGVAYTESIFNRVVKNQKMLRNFVQVIRSGQTGRKSFGSALKRSIQNWLRNQSADNLFKGSVGQSPSLADIVKMVHPKAESTQKNAFYAWLLDKKIPLGKLPPAVRDFERFKSGASQIVPDVDFRMLSALPLSKEQWVGIAENMPWNALRMNLNTLQRHGVFDVPGMDKKIADRLRDAESVRKFNVFPYQLMTTFQNLQGVPLGVSLAIQHAMEIATENVPVLPGKLAVGVDVSSSMDSPVTGNRGSVTTKTTCTAVAALVASCILRKNPETVVIPFDTGVRSVSLNPLDSVMTNAQKLNIHGGGTDCSVPIRKLISDRKKVDLIVLLSDNESWFRNEAYAWRRGTNTQQAWAEYLEKVNRKAKLVCIDLQPNTTVQVVDAVNTFNIGGFSDNVFDGINRFLIGDARDFVQVINDSVTLAGENRETGLDSDEDE